MGSKEYKIWSKLVIYQNIWSYNLEFFNIIYIKSNLMNWQKLKIILNLLLIIKFDKIYEIKKKVCKLIIVKFK
jgi:hypothetical protein